jgi:hypothetical protein
MSSLKVHTVQSLAASAVLYPVMGENVIPFGLACIFIDLDHIIDYVHDTKSFSLMGVFPFSKLLEINLDKNVLVLSAFHTIEFFALIFTLGFFYPVFMYVCAGMVFHMAADLIHLGRQHKIFARAYSLVEYIIRKKTPHTITSVYQLIPHKNLNTAGIPDIECWIEIWRASRSHSVPDCTN